MAWQDHGHIQLVQELAVDQQAPHPAAFVDEAHALIQGNCPVIVGHHVELDPMQAAGTRPALCLLQQSSADAFTAHLGQNTDDDMGRGPAPPELPPG